MYGLIISILVSMHTNAQAQSAITAVHEETPQGLVRIDANGDRVGVPEQPRSNTTNHTTYQNNVTATNFIHQPTYRVVDVYFYDCDCTRFVKVRVN